MDHFELVSTYKSTRDQPQAIEKLAKGVHAGKNSRFYWALPVLVKRLPWPTSLQK